MASVSIQLKRLNIDELKHIFYMSVTVVETP